MALFSSLEDVASARAAAIITEALCADEYARVEVLLRSIEEGVAEAPLPNISPDVAWFYSASYVIVVCGGTENWRQMFGNVFNARQISQPPLKGGVHAEFAAQAKAIVDEIGPGVESLLASRTLVLMGHSRGGAVAQLLAGYWGADAHACRCYTFGSPNVGDEVFAASVEDFIIRYENDTDSICVIPLETSDPDTYRMWEKWFGLRRAPLWAPAGQQRSLLWNGNIATDRARPTFPRVFDQFVGGDYSAHAMTEYRRRLTLGKPDPFSEDQVWNPPAFNAEATFQAAADSQNPNAPEGQGESMATPLCAGTIFFKTLDRTFGWTETWYAAMSVGSMLTALQNITAARLAFLSPDCVIYWYRGSIVEIGQPRQSQTLKRSRPAKGTARPGGTVATDYPNSTMDCIVATLVSNQGSKRQEKFRGLPDVWIEDDDLSTSGIGALDIINSYLIQVRGAGLGIRRQTMLPTDKMAITAMTKAANGNINLTVPAHGILTSQPFQALLRGRDLANPMMRGRWNLLVIDGNTLQCISSTRFGIGTGVAGGSVTVSAYGADTIVQPIGQTRYFDFNQVSTIKTGRPSDLHHGKRSPVVRHR